MHLSKEASSQIQLSCAANFGWDGRFQGVGLTACSMGRPSAAKSKSMKGKKSDGKSASSSGSATPRTPTSSPSRSERVGVYDMSSLPLSWDNDEVIRSRLREGKPLLLHYDQRTGEGVAAHVDGTVADVKANIAALAPLACIMANHGLLMPNIDRLIQAVDSGYKVAKQQRSLEECYQTAWAFRRLLVTAKGFCYRECPPDDPQPIYIVAFYV